MDWKEKVQMLHVPCYLNVEHIHMRVVKLVVVEVLMSFGLTSIRLHELIIRLPFKIGPLTSVVVWKQMSEFSPWI